MYSSHCYSLLFLFGLLGGSQSFFNPGLRRETTFRQIYIESSRQRSEISVNTDIRQGDNNLFNNYIFESLGRGITAALFALTLSFTSLSPSRYIAPAVAADGASIASCLVRKCPLPLAKCVANPMCLANVICINTCNGKADETGCQIECGNLFENDIVGEFNKCALTEMDCVPQRKDDGSYPIPSPEVVVRNFDTKLWNGQWYVTAGQNELFDIFPCQVHFFTETAPGKHKIRHALQNQAIHPGI